ncbi:MAG: DUF4239 domain-containing protein [Candidatus Eremiobacteraeota bacterium]|nr:DUF4239 domain-containing protein [Candidatus Eremiobacteraeota bacterium]MBC5828439.1 DUF4239 domain-containing protein [Candidatus Eremiobacteraeota bacterium]
MSIIGTAYAVLLSFMVVVVWQQYNASDETASAEAGAIADLHHLSEGLPAPLSAGLKEELDEYIRVMIGQEWPAMKRGNWSSRAQALSRIMARQIIAFQPKNAAQQSVQQQALSVLRTMLDARRQRLHDNETGIPRILWWTLCAAGAVTVAFSYLFGLENMKIQLIMTAALATTISLTFVLIAELDYPFRGDTAVSPHSWYQIQRQLDSDR